MPKIHDQKTARTRQTLLAQSAGSKSAVRQNLKGLSYEKGAQALGLDPNLIGADPEDLGLDPLRINEDLSIMLRDLYPAFDPLYLRVQEVAGAVSAAYANENASTERSGADGRFSMDMNEMITKVVEICRNAEFTKQADLNSRKAMTKDEKRRRAEKAEKLQEEINRLMAAIALMAAQVARSSEATRVVQLSMLRLMETRNHLGWFYRTFRSEGFEIGGAPAAGKKANEPPPV